MHESRPLPRRLLIVAGSDPTAGAGLQADLKAATLLGCHAMTVVSALTVQNSLGVQGVYPVAPALVEAQMRACLEDIGADAVKLGMLADAGIVASVARVLADYPAVPVVADPVLAGTHGGTLLDAQGRIIFLEQLLPRLTLITPNIPEAVALTGKVVRSLAEMEAAAEWMVAAGAKAALITGGHMEGAVLTDVLVEGGTTTPFSSTRIAGGPFHGTGCFLASAIAAGLAHGQPLALAIEQARSLLRRAMSMAVPLGGGQPLLGFPWRGEGGGSA